MSSPPGGDADRPRRAVVADLHTHTDRSDGRLSPRDLVGRAVDRGLRVLAVTDHDTVAGLAPAREAAEEAGLRFVDGVELSVSLEGEELHLLAYAVDPTHESLRRHLEEMQEARRARAWTIVDRLRDEGLEVEDEELRRTIASTAAVGRPHVAAALVRAGYVETSREAFDRYLGAGGPGFVPKPDFPAGDALAVVHEAGGVGVLAHPGHWTSTAQLRALVAAGLDGLELYHPSHGPSLQHYYRRVARSYDLVVTGGSDYHGRTDEEANRLGDMGLDEDEWERFRAALA